jgi:acyl-coenzyme A synthetase/AMP-(fatty) acid ligase
VRDLPPNMADYLATSASFRLEVPERYNYARDVVNAWAVRAPGKLALLTVGPDGGDARRFSFADLPPREIEFTVELPKTISGKIRRVELREREQATAAD